MVSPIHKYAQNVPQNISKNAETLIVETNSILLQSVIINNQSAVTIESYHS